MPEAKRTTAAVYQRYPEAWDLDRVLQRAGVDSKIVTRHAVQIHPDHVERAKQALRLESARRSAPVEASAPPG